MKPSELLVINICREQRARWTLPQKLIIHSFLSHTLSPCDMQSMELQCFAALNGNSTYSSASIACNCVERYFEMSASLPQTQKPKLEILLCFCRILVALNEVREKCVLQCSLLRRSSQNLSPCHLLSLCFLFLYFYFHSKVHLKCRFWKFPERASTLKI